MRIVKFKKPVKIVTFFSSFQKVQTDSSNRTVRSDSMRIVKFKKPVKIVALFSSFQKVQRADSKRTVRSGCMRIVKCCKIASLSIWKVRSMREEEIKQTQTTANVGECKPILSNV